MTNAGPSAAQGAWVTDELPEGLLNVRYTSRVTGDAAGDTLSGEGNIDDLVAMAPGSTITYFDRRHLSLGYGNAGQHGRSAGSPRHARLEHRQQLRDRQHRADPAGGSADHQVGRSHSAVPGLTRLTYTIVVTNAGPSTAQGAWVTDELPEGLLNVRYSSRVTGDAAGNTLSGEGNIDDLVSMAPGSTITYFVTADISPWATGTLVNTAQVLAPRGTIDTSTANNSATDTTELTPQVDLQITKSDGRDSAVPGLTRLTYTIVVTNAGPSAVSGAMITDDLPDGLNMRGM